MSKYCHSLATFCARQARKCHRFGAMCRSQLAGAHRGQSYVEMVFTVMGISVVIITAIEGSIVLNRGMAVKQLAYQGARYAAANPGLDSTTVLAYVAQAEPKVLQQGAIHVTMNPSTTPRALGSAVSVSVSFTGPTMAVPSVISFPATISATNIAMSQ
jgi:Flp pilus assembly protein TadG